MFSNEGEGLSRTIYIVVHGMLEQTCFHLEMSLDTTKRTNRRMQPAKTQIRLQTTPEVILFYMLNSSGHEV